MITHNPGGSHHDGASPKTMSTYGVLLFALLGASSVIVGCDRESPAKQMLKQYVNQASCPNRAKFTLDGDKDRSRMESFYETGTSCIKEGELDTAACDTVPIGEYCTASMTEKTSLGKSRAEYCIRRTGNVEYKVDWACSVGWNETSLAVVKTGNLNRALVLRLQLQLGNLYTSEFENKTRWQSINARDENGNVYAYVRKDKVIAKALLALLQDGGYHKVTVVVTHPLGLENFDRVEIISVVRPDWRTPNATESPNVQRLYENYIAPGAVESKIMLDCGMAIERATADAKGNEIINSGVASLMANTVAKRLFADESAATELKLRLAQIRAYLEDKKLPVPNECQSQ